MKKRLFSAIAILGLVFSLSSCVVYEHDGGYHRHYHHHRHYYREW